jgi:hypothetical protein
MTFSRPLAFIEPDGRVIANIGWGEVQAAWESFRSGAKAAA